MNAIHDARVRLLAMIGPMVSGTVAGAAQLGAALVLVGLFGSSYQPQPE